MIPASADSTWVIHDLSAGNLKLLEINWYSYQDALRLGLGRRKAFLFQRVHIV